MTDSDPVAIYDRQAAALAASYDDPRLLEVYAQVSALLQTPPPDALALDVGAGSGRDAAWLEQLGYEVVAVEPAAAMRAEGEQRHASARIRWLGDRLPGLAAIHGLGLAFDLILLSGVWQHVAPGDRARAFRKLSTLLKPGGQMLITLRHGPAPANRPMHAVSLGEIEALARWSGLEIVRVQASEDELGREGVSWTLVMLRWPDDGAGALPLIRGIILGDDKSSTYKLALLRAVGRIAEHAPAAALPDPRNDDAIQVPLGLVALMWIRMMLPLVRLGLPQAPKNAGPDGLGFAKAGFRALLDMPLTAPELRVGARFEGDRAAAVHGAIGEAANTIATMPANFIRFPNSDVRVFSAERGRVGRSAPAIELTIEQLGAWGTLTVPGNLWRAMSRLGAWIEPMLVAEWARMMRSYAERQGTAQPIGQAEAALVWEEPVRDTLLGRAAANRLLGENTPLRCVWSGKPIGAAQLDIDHCLPWSVWPCGDLWNLMPAERRLNQHQKRDRLPSQATLAAARSTILAWWEAAWCRHPMFADRFAAEARAALPVDDPTDLEAVHAALEWRRLRLRQDQQVPEWHYAGATS